MKDLFEKSINTEIGPIIFSFEKIHFESGLRYHLRFKDEHNSQKTCILKPGENGKWVFEDQLLPTWIFALELDFNDAIDEN